MDVMRSSEEILRRLAIGDRTTITALAGAGDTIPESTGLDERTLSLVRVAVLVPLDAPQSSYQAAVEAAMRAGASLDDLLATLLATIEAVGWPRAVSAAPRIALAAGYDVDAAFEEAAPWGG
jgi:alkylhydroperoxidase/carboxymuconolactone decarboxylase family protein YurZ